MISDEENIRALIQRWHSATAEGDVDTVLTLMAEDVEFLVPGKEPMRGRPAFASGLRALLKTNRIHSSGDVQEIQVSGDLAVAVTRLQVRVIPLDAGAQEHARSGYAMSVFHRQRDGDWLLIKDANFLPSSA